MRTRQNETTWVEVDWIVLFLVVFFFFFLGSLGAGTLAFEEKEVTGIGTWRVLAFLFSCTVVPWRIRGIKMIVGRSYMQDVTKI